MVVFFLIKLPVGIDYGVESYHKYKGVDQATLEDLESPVPMDTTGMSVTTATESMGFLMAPGSFFFDATPGDYFVSFYGFADVSSPEMGEYRIEISKVPVPAAVWLMGSGLLGLIGFSRKSKA